MRIVWVQVSCDQNSINEGGSNTAATPLVKKICIETAANDPCPNNTGTRSISSCFLMQQTAGCQNRESLLQQATRIPNPNSMDVEMELDQTTNPNSMDVEMEVEETSDPNSVHVEMDVQEDDDISLIEYPVFRYSPMSVLLKPVSRANTHLKYIFKY